MKKILQALKKAKIILLVTHQRPDGDGVGSILGMAHWLEKLGKKYFCFCLDPINPYLQFLPKSEEIKQDRSLWNNTFDLLLVLDSGDLKYAGIEESVKELKHDFQIINIDHHATNDHFGHLNLVDATAAATCEIIYDLLDEARAINPIIATCLLTGIITDTGCFSNLNTTHRVMHKAGRLLNKGANFRQITLNTLHHRPINILKLWGKALERLEEKDGIVTTMITKKDLEECQVNSETLEGVANFLNILDPDQNKVIMVFSEKKDGQTKVSLRSAHRLVDVAQFAKIMGGGGHSKAAGFDFAESPTTEKISTVRDKLIKYLKAIY